MASTDWGNAYRACGRRGAALGALLAAAAALAGCSQTVTSGLPELQPVNNVLTADQQKKAIDDLQTRRDQQEADTRQQAKTER